MIYESTRKMSVKEQEVYDLGYLNGKHAAMCSPWVKTADRLPTEADGYVIGLQKSRFDCGDGLVPFVTWYAGLNVTKSECVYWMPLPKLPEVEE